MTELRSREVHLWWSPNRTCPNMLSKKGISVVFNFRGHLTIPLI